MSIDISRRMTFSNQTLQHGIVDASVCVVDDAEETYASWSWTSDLAERVSSSDENLESQTSDLREFIGFEFSLVPQVEFVFTALRANSVFYAWIVVDAFESAVREKIYRRQEAIIDEFPTFEFDFYIVARDGRNIDDLFGDPSMHLTYSKSVRSRAE